MMSFGSGFPSCASTDAFRFRAAWASDLPGQGDVEVRGAGASCARGACRSSGRHGHVHHPVDPLVLEEVLPELGQLVVPVGLEAAEQLFGAPPA